MCYLLGLPDQNTSFNTDISFFTVLETEVSSQGTGSIGSFQGLSPWLVDGLLSSLPLCLHVVFPLCSHIPNISLCLLIFSSYKDISMIGIEPIHGFILT